MSTNLDLSRFKMPLHGHDIADGVIEACQVCGSADLALVVDLGHQPLCDTLLTAKQLGEPEKYFPLRLYRCIHCNLTQLDYAVPGSEVYHPEYPYRSGITAEVVQHMQGMAHDCVTRLPLNAETLVVDVGCNDGTLLSAFKKRGVKTLGVEPTNIANIARGQGVEVIQSFFDEGVASGVRKSHQAASLITATNVFAHMSSLGAVMRGIKALLSKDGHFVCEVHYLPEILRKNQYDSIYHEHVRTYSLKSLVVLFHLYDMVVSHVELMDRYSGTLRVFASNDRAASPDSSVAELLHREDVLGLGEERPYAAFRDSINQSRTDLMQLALDAQRRGQSFVGNSCPGRSSTLLNFVGIDRALMPYICEQPTSLKLGMHLPGKHIPVVDNRCLEKAQPDYIVLLAWHYADPIIKELRGRGIRSKLVLPLPGVSIVE